MDDIARLRDRNIVLHRRNLTLMDARKVDNTFALCFVGAGMLLGLFLGFAFWG